MQESVNGLSQGNTLTFAPEEENLLKFCTACMVGTLHAKFLHLYTGLFEMIVGVLTTCHTQYT